MKNGYHVIKKGEQDFPRALYQLEKVPERLYVMGNIEALHEFSLSVVGSRSASEYRKRHHNEYL